MVSKLFTTLKTKSNAYLLYDLDKGGLKAPHLKSVIKSQRIMCCKKFAENQQSNWKIILSHYMKNMGSKLILRCAFDLKKLCIQLPMKNVSDVS